MRNGKLLRVTATINYRRVREQNQVIQTKEKWSSYKERKGNALALGADEGRSNLRKAAGSRKQASIRGYPNGETRLSNTQSAYGESIVIRGEPPELKHLSRARKRNQPRFRK